MIKNILKRTLGESFYEILDSTLTIIAKRVEEFFQSLKGCFFLATFTFFYYYYAFSLFWPGLWSDWGTFKLAGFFYSVTSVMDHPWKFLMHVYVLYILGMLVCKIFYTYPRQKKTWGWLKNSLGKARTSAEHYWFMLWSQTAKMYFHNFRGSEPKFARRVIFSRPHGDYARGVSWWVEDREAARYSTQLSLFFCFWLLFFFSCYLLSLIFDNSVSYVSHLLHLEFQGKAIFYYSDSHWDVGEVNTWKVLPPLRFSLPAVWFIYFFNFVGTGLFIVVLLRWPFWKTKPVANFEFLLVSFNVFMVLFFLSHNLVVSFACLEGFSFALYALAAFNTKSHRSVESAVKYFCLGSVSSGLFLYGISLLYGLVGSSSFEEIRKYLAIYTDLGCGIICPPLVLYLSAYLVIFGFLFKLSAFPCHIWTPDVYEGAPSPVTAIFAVIAKFGVFLFFLKFLLVTFFNVPNLLSSLLLFSAIGSLVIGCFGALVQKKIKRFVAYTSINQVGFLLMGLSCGTFYGFFSSLLHMQIYYFMGIAFFTIILTYGIFFGVRGNVLKFRELTYLSDLTGLANSNNRDGVPVMLTLILFSMAGIPPLAGFFSKYFILVAVSEASNYLLVVTGLFVNVISAFYYIKIINRMWFTGPYVSQKDIGPADMLKTRDTMEIADDLAWVARRLLLIHFMVLLLVIPLFLEVFMTVSFDFVYSGFKNNFGCF